MLALRMKLVLPKLELRTGEGELDGTDVIIGRHATQADLK
jgi:hypothetical protein